MNDQENERLATLIVSIMLKEQDTDPEAWDMSDMSDGPGKEDGKLKRIPDKPTLLLLLVIWFPELLTPFEVSHSFSQLLPVLLFLHSCSGVPDCQQLHFNEIAVIQGHELVASLKRLLSPGLRRLVLGKFDLNQVVRVECSQLLTIVKRCCFRH